LSSAMGARLSEFFFGDLRTSYAAGLRIVTPPPRCGLIIVRP
jgi:hypothetical protein